jgi:hypothetical protein
MRYSRLLLIMSALLPVSSISAFAQRQSLTDAQRDGLSGAVKGVSVTSTRTDVAWAQPGGPTLVIPVWCQECEFDTDGNELKSGRIFEGTFLGRVSRLVRDANGHVSERFVSDASTRELLEHDSIAVFGNTEESVYLHGKLQSRTVLSYDVNGHITDRFSFDGEGNQIAHRIEIRNAGGSDTEGFGWDKDGQLQSHFRQTFEPRTEVEQFTEFNTSGGVELTWTVVKGKLLSFWESKDAGLLRMGDNFSEHIGNDTSENYACHDDGTCELSRIHYVYPDSNRRSPVSAEWRDQEGNLRFAAYYAYEFDAYHNWTHREIWVWSKPLGERKLYETDSRSITYWP